MHCYPFIININLYKEFWEFSAMFWKKKEDEKQTLPDLPPTRPVFNAMPLPPEKPEAREMPEKHALPTFPSSSTDSKFSEAAIKEAVEENEKPEEEKADVFPEPPEEEEKAAVPITKFPEKPVKRPLPVIQELKENQSPPRRIKEFTPGAQKSEDIYVKIDKFHSARKSLTAARQKLHEIDDLLRKIRETKLREEQELHSWEKEIEEVKAKIEDVTNNIFEKVE